MLVSRSASLVAWRGASELDGAPIVAIVTGLARPSANAKTGPMAQLWILPADVAPHVAQRTGADRSVCGACPLRPILARPGDTVCYVRTYHGPRSTWESAAHAPADLALACDAIRARGLPLRLGAYGDPAALPEHVITALCGAARAGWTGYTHAWRLPRARYLRRYVMASVEREADAWMAWLDGWRTYRITPAARRLARIESHCPAYTHGVQCFTCRLCDGRRSDTDTRRSITIEAH